MTIRDFRSYHTAEGNWHSALIRDNGTDLHVHDRAGFWALTTGRDLIPVQPHIETTLRAAVAQADPWAHAGRRS